MGCGGPALARSWSLGRGGGGLGPQTAEGSFPVQHPAGLGRAVGPLLPALRRRQGGRCSERALVPAGAGELLPQSLEAGPLLRVLVPAPEHQPVCRGRAPLRAGHAVARVHPQEGLVVGHACGEQDRRLPGAGPVATCPVPPRPLKVTPHFLPPFPGSLWSRTRALTLHIAPALISDSRP